MPVITNAPTINYKLDGEKGREFENYQQRLAPPWLRTPEAAAFLASFGKLKDRLVARAKEAVKAGFPASAPTDALAYLGADVVLERGLTETEASYRARIAAAFDSWQWAGTEKGLLDYALAPSGLTNCAVIINREWSEDFGGVPPDGDTDRWSRFWLVIAEPHSWTDDGLWANDSEWGEDGDPGIWGTSATDEEIASVRRLVETWSPAHARCMGVFVVLGNGTATDPDSAPASAPWTYLDLLFGGQRCSYWAFES